MTLPNLFLDSNRALTFTIGDSQFGIEVTSILSFSDAFNEIRSPSESMNGLLGYLDYRENLIQVYECATLLSRPLKRKTTLDLISTIEKYKTSHTEWFDTIDTNLKKDLPLEHNQQLSRCDFTRWLDTLETCDAGLQALLTRLYEPHGRLHSLVDELSIYKEQGKPEKAQKAFDIEKIPSLQRFTRLLQQVQDYLSSGIHPVVLHLTKDGHTPWFSLVLDEIDDIIDYDPSWIDKSAANTLKNEPVSGYIRHKSGAKFMMLSVNALAECSGLDRP